MRAHARDDQPAASAPGSDGFPCTSPPAAKIPTAAYRASGDRDGGAERARHGCARRAWRRRALRRHARPGFERDPPRGAVATPNEHVTRSPGGLQPLDGGAQALGDPRRVLLAAPGKQQRELLAAEAIEQLERPQERRIA